MEEMKFNFLAIGVTVIATFFLGFLWYTPLFGKIWGREMGYPADMKPDPKVLIKGMLFMVIGNFLMAFVFAHNIKAWEFVPGIEKIPVWGNIMFAAGFTWLGFYVPGELGATVWEKKSWTLFFINTSYHLLSLVLAASILIMWK